MSMWHLRSDLREWLDWRRRGYAAPSPSFIKRQVLLRYGHPDATWIETGTYRGDTTAVLARASRRVISLEPAPELYAAARVRFKNTPNVEILNSGSEAALPEIMSGLSGKVCFWLDGHFSGGPTFKGPNDTPILNELATVGDNLSRWDSVAVLVDDLRLFTGNIHSYGPYPPLPELVAWADRHHLLWHIEHDILVARSSPRT
jgi:hypothetical protein